MQTQNGPSSRTMITSKMVFIITLIVIVCTVLSIWLLGLGQHRTIFKNSILSTSILSGAFFLFLSIGLYNGFKLKDNLGNIVTKSENKKKRFSLKDLGFDFEPSTLEFLEGDEGIAGIIIGIISWIVFSILILALLWIFSEFIWVSIPIFIAMLYWIFFRALRLVFKNAKKCRNNFMNSISYAAFYTLLYNFWIYGIIFLLHYV